MAESKPRIQRRLIIGFGSLIALFIAATAFSNFEISKVRASLDQINTVNSVKQRFAINFRGSVHDRAISLRDVTLTIIGAHCTPIRYFALYTDHYGGDLLAFNWRPPTPNPPSR